MKLFEITDNEKIHHAELQFMSRGNSRRGQWSTIGMERSLARHGYKMEPVFEPSGKGKALIQKVAISGTRDEILRQRKEISDIVRIASQGVMRARFKLID